MPAKLPKDPIINQLNNTVEGETTTSIPTKTDSRSSSTQKRMYASPSGMAFQSYGYTKASFSPHSFRSRAA